MFSFLSSSSSVVLPSSMKEIPDDLKGSAVIEISSQGESCRHAIQSILRNPKFFKDVHIVYHAFTGSEHSYYPGWDKDLQALKDVHLEPFRHATLNLQQLQTLLLVRIPPDAQVQEGALMQGYDALAYPSCNEAGISSQLELVEYEDTSSMEYLEMFIAYGFLIPLLFLDACRSLVRLFQYNRTCDLRFERLSRVYPATNREAPDRWFLWWIGTGVAMNKRGHGALKQCPSDQGIAFLMRTIKTHRYLHWIGIWWIALWFYYAFFALPWWNLFLSPDYGLGSYLVRDMSQLRWMLWYLLHIFMVGLVAWSSIDEYPSYTLIQRFRLSINFLGLHVLLSSVYLTFLPLVIFVCKIYQLKDGNAKKKKLKR